MESLSEALTPLLLNLYVAYTDNRSEKMNYRSFTELLNHMKVIEKSREAETSYLKVFREFAVKSGNEYFVTHTEFPNLLKQIKMLNSTRLEFQSNKAFNNLVRVLLKNKFKHFQSLFGDSSEFLIDTIVSNSNFAPYEDEYGVFFHCFKKDPKLNISSFSPSTIGRLYRSLIEFHQSGGTIPTLLSKKELMLVINSVTNYLQRLKDSTTKSQDNLSFLKSGLRDQNLSSVAYLNLFRKGAVDPNNISELMVFKFLFVVVFEMIKQIHSKQIIDSENFFDKYCCYVLQKLAKNGTIQTKQLVRTRSQSVPKSRLSPLKKNTGLEGIMLSMLQDKKLEPKLKNLMLKYSGWPKLEISDLIRTENYLNLTLPDFRTKVSTVFQLMDKVSVELFTSLEERILVEFLPDMSEYFYSQISLVPPEFSVRVSRHRLCTMLGTLGLTNYTNQQTYSAEGIIVAGLNNINLVKRKHKINSVAIAGHAECIDYSEFLKILSVYVHKIYSIHEDKVSAIMYKMRTAYQNVVDVVSVVLNQDTQDFRDCHSQSLEFLRGFKGVIT